MTVVVVQLFYARDVVLVHGAVDSTSLVLYALKRCSAVSLL